MVPPLKKARRQYPAEIIMDADNADDLTLLAYRLVQIKFLLYSLEQTARGIGLCMNSDKTEFMCFKQDGTISTLNDKPLELIDHF